MNEFGFLADSSRRDPRFGEDLGSLALRLAGTPVGTRAKRQGFPDLELLALVETHLAPLNFFYVVRSVIEALVAARSKVSGSNEPPTQVSWSSWSLCSGSAIASRTSV
jgi:hypothetical protein